MSEGQNKLTYIYLHLDRDKSRIVEFHTVHFWYPNKLEEEQK